MKTQRRRFSFLSMLFATIAITSALFTIFGLWLKDSSISSSMDDALQVVAVTIVMSVVLGILNLFSVHLGRITKGKGGWGYSIITLLTAIVVIAIQILDDQEVWKGDLANEKLSPVLFRTLEVSIESALAGLIGFFLIYAAYRLLSKRAEWSSYLFIFAVLIGLLGWVQLTDTTVFTEINDWIMKVPVLAGSRGMLIGIGLASIIVGVRTLTGTDQAYRED